jgi:folate-binding protein YgfZ
MITSPGLQSVVIDWLYKYTITEDIYLEDITTETEMMVLVGPESHVAIEHVTGIAKGELKKFQYMKSSVADKDISVMPIPSEELQGYYVLSVDRIDTLLGYTPFSEMPPIGHEVMDVLRIESGIPAFPSELGDDFNPIEAGLIGSINFNKGCYIGQEIIARLDTYNKVKRSLVTLGSIGSKLIYEGIEMGVVTSWTRMPINGQSIGLGYVRKQVASVGTCLSIPNGEEGGIKVTGIPLMFGPG